MGSKISRVAGSFPSRKTRSEDPEVDSTEHHEFGCTCGIDPGSIEYYNLVARQYGNTPSEIARVSWMKELMVEYEDWVGFDQIREHGGSIKILDYCAGTGFLSRALAPHVNKILAMDSSQNMTIQYNRRVEQTQEDHPDCEMRAVLGDLIYGKVPVAEIPSQFLPFDVVAMCLAVDFFAPDDSSDDDAPGLARALGSLTSRLRQNGMLLILDIEKDYTGDGANENENEDYQAKSERTRNGKKIVGYGSDEVRVALEALGMEDIVVQEDLWYEEPSDEGQVYFLLKARKGDGYQDPVGEEVIRVE